jgi:uncharacterized paraquat-inducible protein A
MRILCTLGLHCWSRRETARPGTTVHRCARCDARLIIHNGRERRRKRVYLAAAFLVSAAIWFVSYNLVFHGRTKVLHTASKAANKAGVVASRGRTVIHRIEGDSGAYVEGND